MYLHIFFTGSVTHLAIGEVHMLLLLTKMTLFSMLNILMW